MVTQIYKIWSEILGPFKIWRDFGKLRDSTANISGTQQDTVNQKIALQTTDTPAQANLIWYTVVHKRQKIGLEF